MAIRISREFDAAPDFIAAHISAGELAARAIRFLSKKDRVVSISHSITPENDVYRVSVLVTYEEANSG